MHSDDDQASGTHTQKKIDLNPRPSNLSFRQTVDDLIRVGFAVSSLCRVQQVDHPCTGAPDIDCVAQGACAGTQGEVMALLTGDDMLAG